MSSVTEALKTVITGESEAVRKYKAFSEVAKEEGLLNIALLFKALVKAEKIHIRNHSKALGEKFTPELRDDIELRGSTAENIEAAIKGEQVENKTLYPKLMKSIKKELSNQRGKVANLSMTWAMKVEKNHAKLLKLALLAAQAGKDLEFEAIYVCDVCGNLVVDDGNNKECEVCGHDIIFFKQEQL